MIDSTTRRYPGLGLALVAAVLLTAAITVPLAVVANRSEPSAPSDDLVVTQGDTSLPADGADLAPEVSTIITWEDPTIVAASWALHEGGEEIARGDAAGTIPLTLGSVAMATGTFDFLVTGTTQSGETERRAASWTVREAG